MRKTTIKSDGHLQKSPKTAFSPARFVRLASVVSKNYVNRGQTVKRDGSHYRRLTLILCMQMCMIHVKVYSAGDLSFSFLYSLPSRINLLATEVN